MVRELSCLVDSIPQPEEVLKMAKDCSEQLINASNWVAVIATKATVTFAACKLGRRRLFV